MFDPLDVPPRAINTADVAAQPIAPRRRRHHWGLIALLVLLVIPATVFGLYTWTTLSFVYSRGQRVGYVQKMSKKGWLCPTWEGELAMFNYPGTNSQIFDFTVRSDSVAHFIEENAGKHMAVVYEQHRGVPLSCFGETEYFVVAAHPE